MLTFIGVGDEAGAPYSIAELAELGRFFTDATG